MTVKNLTVRLDPETRETLELVAEREMRTMANQIVVFVRQSLDRYLEENDLEVAPDPFGSEGSDNPLKLHKKGQRKIPF